MGWNYWSNWAVTAADPWHRAWFMAYWFPAPRGCGAVGFLVIVVGPTRSARVYGEAEFWLHATVVIATIFGPVGVFMIAGVMGDNSPGLLN